MQRAGLLEDEAAFSLLDTLADGIELQEVWRIERRERVADHELALVHKICKMVRLAEAIETDQGLARQLVRKFVA